MRQNYLLCGNTCCHIFFFNLFIGRIDSWNLSPWKTKNCQGHGWQHRYKQPWSTFRFAIGHFKSPSLSWLLQSTRRLIYYIQQHRVCITRLASPCKHDLVITTHMSFGGLNIIMAALAVPYSIGPLVKWSNFLQTTFLCIFSYSGLPGNPMWSTDLVRWYHDDHPHLYGNYITRWLRPCIIKNEVHVHWASQIMSFGWNWNIQVTHLYISEIQVGHHYACRWIST